jgi:hypothetical protein
MKPEMLMPLQGYYRHSINASDELTEKPYKTNCQDSIITFMAFSFEAFPNTS